MRKYMSLDTGETWTEEEVRKAYEDLKDELEYNNFEEYLDHLLSLGAQKIGGLVEVELPFTQPERKKGEWIEHKYAEIIEGSLLSNYECSRCHSQELADSKFCPNCGADMRGE